MEHQSKSYSEPPVVEHNRVITRVSPEESFQLTAVGDEIWFFQLPGRGKLLGGGLEAATPFGGDGQAAVIATDGTTEVTLVSGIDLSAAAISDALATGVAGWLGTIFQGRGWRLVLRVTTAPAAPFDATVRGYVTYTMDVEGGELPPRTTAPAGGGGE